MNDQHSAKNLAIAAALIEQHVPLASESAQDSLAWLKEDKEACDAEERDDARRIAHAWAFTRARGRSRDVKRVAALTFDGYGDDEPAGAQRLLAGALLDDTAPHWDDVGDAMEGVFGSREPTVNAIGGFIDGVIEIDSKL